VIDTAHDFEGVRRRLHDMYPESGPGWHAAIDAGHDVTLIDHALSLTPAERFADHQRFLDMIARLENARDGADPIR
jgi:hypothetical protein